MRKSIMAAAIGTMAIATAVMPGTVHAADATIDAFEMAQQAAWNAHDAAAYAAAFDAKADIVTALGWQWSGQAAAARNIGDGFRYVYAQARLQLADVRARMVAPDLAAVTLAYTITGARAIDTGRPAAVQQEIETQLLQRRGGSWVVLVQQDTATTMPRALPAPAAVTAAPPPAALPSAFPTAAPPVRRCVLGRANGDCLIYGKAR